MTTGNLNSLISSLLSSPSNISVPFSRSILASTFLLAFAHMPSWRIWTQLSPWIGRFFLRSVLLISPWVHWIYRKETTMQIWPSAGYPHESLGRPQHPGRKLVFSPIAPFLHWSKNSNILMLIVINNMI